MALIERYVRPDAAGGGDGTTDANSGANGAWTLAEMAANYAPGMRVNVRATNTSGTTTGPATPYSQAAATLTLNAAGTTTAPVLVRGYNAVPGDIELDPTLAKPRITFTTGQFVGSGTHHTISNLDVSGAFATNSQVRVTAAGWRFDRCRIENTNAASASRAFSTSSVGQGVILNRCLLKATAAADAAASLSGSGIFTECVFLGGGHGFLSTVAVVAVFLRCLFLDNGGDGAHFDTGTPSSVIFDGCTFWSPAGDGIEFAVAPTNTNSQVSNCLFSECGGYGINQSSGTAANTIFRANNDFYLNVLGPEDGFGDSPSFSQQAETSDPFVDAAGGDFSLATGAVARGKASPYPGTFENQSYASYRDIGAVQSAGTTATYTAASNVRSGTDRGDGTFGTLVVPAAANVLSGTTFDNGTAGTATVPTTAQVLAAVTYGAGGTALTGTVVLPSASDVEEGVTYGPSSGTTGTFVVPAVTDVAESVQYGAGGTEFTGTLLTGGATVSQIQAMLDAGVRISVGEGTGQLNIANGVVEANVVQGAGEPVTLDPSLPTDVAAIKAKTDNLPASPAAVGDAMTLANGAIGTATFASGATIPRVTLADTLTTYTGNTPQTGDAYARIGANGAGLTALGDTRLAQIAGAFTGSTSVFSSAALANAPAGGGGSGLSLAELQDELDSRYLTTQIVAGIAAVSFGNFSENSDHTTTSFADVLTGTARVTSTNTPTSRTVTVH